MKNLLLRTLGLLLVLFSLEVTAQVTCYGEESKTPDFWLDHFYYAKCTDYESTGSQLFGGNLDCVEFTAGSTIDFTDIYVSKDAVYTVILYYGIGWCDELGAYVDLNVNGQFTDQLVLFPSAIVGEDATYQFEVELYSDYNNVIQLKNVKDWPAFRGFQLSSNETTKVATTDKNICKVFFTNGSLFVENMLGVDNHIQINSIDGRLIKSVTTDASSYTTSLSTGLYVVNVNGNLTKIFVK